MEEWISLSEYMKRYHIGYKEVKRMIDGNELEHRKTNGGQYKIKIGGNTVSREMYEIEKEKRIQAETKLNLVLKIVEGVNTNEKGNL